MNNAIIFVLSLYLHTCLSATSFPISIDLSSPYTGVDPVVFKPSINVNRGNLETTTEVVSTTSPRFIEKVVAVAPNLSRPSCGIRRVIHTELIRNGSPTKPGDWPWHVALYRNENRGVQRYICGGTIVNQYSVITAAHCVTEKSNTILPERLFIIAGKHSLLNDNGEQQEKSVFSIIVHPEFTRTTLNYDIAILKLSSSVKYDVYVQPICLWDRNNNSKYNIFNRIGTIVGWGFTEADHISEELAVARIPVVGDVPCINTNPLFYSRYVNDYSFCAGYRNGTSACNGDSGSGMYFSENNNDNQEVWYLRGLVSLTVSRKDTNICDPLELTVFTDVAQFHDFFDKNL